MRRLLACSLILLAACSGSPDGEPSLRSPTVASPSASPTPDTLTSEPNRRFEHATGTVAIPNERYLPMWHRPGPGRSAYVFDGENRYSGGPARSPLLIDGRADRDGERWVKLLLPIRPNGASDWAKVSDVTIRPVFERIVVDLSERVLRHYVRDELVDRLRVGIGAPQYPTGEGTFYVWQRVPFADASGPYGIFALGLSGFSPVLSDWPGEGRMAIHGTGDPTDRGREVSHGCVRVYNPDMRSLVDVPLGTPVVIRP